jgi:hypothetical protein
MCCNDLHLLNHTFLGAFENYYTVKGELLFRDDHLFNPLNAELNLIWHLLALLAHLILHVGKIRVKMIRPVVSAYYKVNKYMSSNYVFS